MGRLDRLELENFKSYKGHQTIGPFHNFTSVIGPNGAGKSNLMDAISFVLGIKSAQLRSSQLKDLIYRGRAMQEDDEEIPDGMAIEGRTNNPKRAWVMAVYKDDNGNEIKFTRSITTSGASEYKINNKVVTYAKYNSTLEQQNILVKARNFLVFQGDVEAIASQSPKDLTRLIEQISGSLELRSEYEQLKVQQERATENSAFNFNKKRGINSEIQEYQRQKAQAQQFEKLQAEKTQILVDYLLWKLFHIQQNIQEYKEEIDEHNDVIERRQREQGKFDSELKEARMEQSKVHKEYFQMESDIKLKEKELEEKRPALLTVEEKIFHSRRKLNQYEQDAERVRKDFDRQTNHVVELQSELDKITRSAEQYEASLQAGGGSNKRLNAEDMTEYSRKREEANKKTVNEKQRLVNVRRQEKTCRESTHRLKEKMEDLDRRRKQLEEEKLAVFDQKEKVGLYVKQLHTDLEAAKKELEAAVTERNSINQHETQYNRELQETLNKLTVASVDQRESEREQKMKECLESLKRVFSGVHGRLLDLFTPSQRKYAVPVSIILGRNMDAIIVDQQKTAIECIQYIREQRLGHATFIPLDTIVVKPINDKYRSFMKGARLAIDVITYNDKLERAFQYACGNTLVCDTLEIAKYICYEKNQQVKAVTLDGTIIHKSGLVTGGHSDDIITGAKRVTEKRRADNIDELRRQRDDLLSKLNNLSKSKRRGNFEEQKKSEISGLESRQKFSQEELSVITRKLEAINNELNFIANETNGLQPRWRKAHSDLTNFENQITQLENTIHRIEDAIFKDFCVKIQVANIREYEQRQLQLAQEMAEKRLKFTTLKSRLQNQLKFESEQRKEAEDRLNKLEVAITNDTERLFQLEREKEQLLRDKRLISDQIAEMQNELNKIKESFDEKTDAVNVAKRKLSQVTKEIERMMKEIVNKESDIEKLEADQFSIFRKCKLEEIHLPLERGSLDDIPIKNSRFQDDDEMDIDQDDVLSSNKAGPSSGWNVQVDYSSLIDDLKENDGIEIAKEFEKKLGEKYAKMEEIAPSLKAIERLDGIEQRLHDTEKEFDSARREAKTAKDRFNAVKQKRCKRFRAAYDHIEKNIDQIYKDLTKSRSFPLGGTAYLSLEDNEEPYLDGVKYHAMPPMKRFRDMEQLSGGEKTMAALALLFAIHSFQPSPFFVLDEVDAALDNTNVGKIANYIREHASDTFQFIVISLKSTLYEKAQALVGIYRDQEVNSSKTLTLQLDKFQE
ncbi:condensin complex subunit SMC1 [Glomus cerebriforme]|uniref:Structural maintenance of chromosomes protein n=1 Tax=Glomus cerebriforme TaxID=658196 RepID=A0A397TGQ0_9GLOM|nr:condensin complex subunit SMC1 [Glomus cerebriforme]